MKKLKILRVVVIVAVVATLGALALELRQARYELRQQVDANANWQEFSTFQNLNHFKVTQSQQAEIARLQQAQSNSVAAH